jgi:RimJ/RimL family protein N-acetyltransferase
MTAPLSLPLAAPVLPLPLPLPRLAADRLVLRGLDPADAAALALHAADRRVAEGTRSIPHPLPPDAAGGFVAAALDPRRDEDVWAIDGTQSGGAHLLGVISLKPLDRGQSQIGYWVAPDFWNAGIASEAVRCLVAANPHGARTLFAEVFQDNPVSARILTHAGFDYIGDAEAVSVARGGASVPTWTYLRRMV